MRGYTYILQGWIDRQMDGLGGKKKENEVLNVMREGQGIFHLATTSGDVCQNDVQPPSQCSTLQTARRLSQSLSSLTVYILYRWIYTEVYTFFFVFFLFGLHCVCCPSYSFSHHSLRPTTPSTPPTLFFFRGLTTNDTRSDSDTCHDQPMSSRLFSLIPFLSLVFPFLFSTCSQRDLNCQRAISVRKDKKTQHQDEKGNNNITFKFFFFLRCCCCRSRRKRPSKVC